MIFLHTHVGIAFIKEKIAKNANVKPSFYNVETISSYSQRYVINLYKENDILEQKDSKKYYPFMITKDTELFALKSVKDMIKGSYTGVFVDEYQGCTNSQHVIIMKLAEVLPIHVLGDPLQDIFEFNKNDPLVNFSDDLNDFKEYLPLNKPWRWCNAKNVPLGNVSHFMKGKLLLSENINLSDYATSIDIVIVDEKEKYTPRTEYNKKIWSLTNRTGSPSILIIEPNSRAVAIREKFTSIFENNFRIIESINDESFYELTNSLGLLSLNFYYANFREFLRKLFSKTGVEY